MTKITKTTTNKTDSKWAIFSSIFMSALVLIVIGLEPFIPQLAAMLPDSLSNIATLVLPAIILMARRFKGNDPIRVVKK